MSKFEKNVMKDSCLVTPLLARHREFRIWLVVLLKRFIMWNFMKPMVPNRNDEDIATLDTPTPWSSPSCNSFPTQLPRRPRIQQTRRHCFGHNFLIRHQNGPFLDALERGRRRRHFGSGPAPEGPWIILCDHGKVLCHLFRPTWPCIVSGLKPKLWAPNP